MTPAERYEFYLRLRKANPEPKTELKYSSVFELLIAVILSAQATDVSVNKVTPRLFAIANTPELMLTLGVEGLKSHIKTIGLYNSKAQNIIKSCQLLVEKHQSSVPEDRVSLEALPGVGRKTANVILNTAFAHPTMAVDTHIFRVANRTGLAPGRNVREVEENLLKNTPDEFKLNAHHWLILHGRYTCTARKPHCASCIVHDLCDYWRTHVRDE